MAGRGKATWFARFSGTSWDTKRFMVSMTLERDYERRVTLVLDADTAVWLHNALGRALNAPGQEDPNRWQPIILEGSQWAPQTAPSE